MRFPCQLSVLFCGAALLTGCGGSDPAPAPAPPAAPVVTTTTTPPATTTTTTQPPAPPDASAQDDALDAALREIDAQVAAADFNTAYQRVLELRQDYAGDPRGQRLDRLRVEIMQHRRSAAELAFAIQNLADPSEQTVRIAERALERAGETGLILLRKTVREDTAEVAAAAARLLGEQKDDAAVPLLAARFFGDDTPGPLRTAAADALHAMADALPTTLMQRLYDLARRAPAEDDTPRQQAIRILLRAYASGDAADATTAADAFDARVERPGAAFVLRVLLRAAMQDDDPARRAWAQERMLDAGFLLAGLRGSYHAGTDFGTLVFERLDPTVHIPNLTYGYPDGRSEDLSVRWTGLLRIETPGQYVLTTASDDGQRLWLNDELRIDDWNMHGVEAHSTTVTLEPGLHDLRIEHMQGTGGGEITLSWQGPGGLRGVIPAEHLRTVPWPSLQTAAAPVGLQETGVATDVLTALYLDDALATAVRDAVRARLEKRLDELGVAFLGTLVERLDADEGFARRDDAAILAAVFTRSAERSDERLAERTGRPAALDVLKAYAERTQEADDEALAAWGRELGVLAQPGWLGAYFVGAEFGKPVLERLDATIDFDQTSFGYPDGRSTELAIRWTGTLLIPQAGAYAFHLGSDDGSRLWLDGERLIDQWQGQSFTTKSVSRELDAHAYAVRIEFFQGGGPGGVRVEWEGPGIERSLLGAPHVVTEEIPAPVE